MTTRTVVQQAKPADGLLKLCDEPVLVVTKTVRDITDNSNARQVAFDKCAARLRCLVWWINAADRKAPPAECSSDGTAPDAR